ncbi:GNAT family N-acetyltransferase [Piscinibacter sakaiensis]|uniref:GNAT family N-acetyltransferase n=1 Tax=Piscinibacter sakaiensis TaxID=1547922 RepID=UPI003AAE672E
MAAMSRDLIEAGLAWRYTPRRMMRMISGPEVAAVVADDAARISGFAVMQFGDETGHLVLLCVARPLQRQGIATALLDWLLASARVAGLERIGVEMRADNVIARNFYRMRGFSELDRIADYYASGIDAQRMSLQLRPPQIP